MRTPGRKTTIFVTEETERVLRARGNNLSSAVRRAVAGHDAMVANCLRQIGKPRSKRLLRELDGAWESVAVPTRAALLYPLWGTTLYREFRRLSDLELMALYDLWLRQVQEVA